MAKTENHLSSMPFARVLAEEMECIKWRRASLLDPERTDSEVPRPAQEADGNGNASPEKQKRLDALDMHLSGLAISGGGIRSATFALGVLQGLASLRLLSKFDYLSTVSGGGYIGSWLAAWVKREGDVDNVERQLSPSRVEQGSARRLHLGDMVVVDEEPEPVRHLRSYSNYLTPKLGLLSADTWALLAIYLRNFLVNLLVLLPSTIALVTAVRLVVLLYATPAEGSWARLGIGMGVLFLVLLTGAFCVIAWQLRRMQGRRMRDPQIGGVRPGQPRERPEHFELDDGLIRRWVVTPLVVAAAAGCYAFMVVPTGPEDFMVNMGQLVPKGDWKALEWSGQEGRLWGPLASPMSLPAALTAKAVGYQEALDHWRFGGRRFRGAALRFLGFFAIFHGLIHLVTNARVLTRDVLGGRGRPQADWWERVRTAWRLFIAPFASGALGGFLFYVLIAEFLSRFPHQPAAIATFGPPLTLLIFAVAAIAEVALLGGCLEEDEREWWASVCGFIVRAAIAWMLIFAVVLYVPRLMFELRRWDYSGAGVVLAWIVTSISGVLAGRSSGTPAGRGPGAEDRPRSVLLSLLTAVAPAVFLVGLLAAVALLVAWLIPTISSWPWTRYPEEVAQVTAVVAWGWFLGSLATALVMMRVVDVNLFSLHAMYANRLTRCYLGASRPKGQWLRRWSTSQTGAVEPSGAPTGVSGTPRTVNRVTGFDFDDDLPLSRLRYGPAAPESQGEDQPYLGPYPLINTTLNLVAGDELAWQDRKAESFVLTPNHCGSRSTGYQPTPTDHRRSNLTIGRAVAISGAAADPNMGYNQSAPVTALMTVFNARLGWWIENPSRPLRGWWKRGPLSRLGERPGSATWGAESPSYGGLLWKELFGGTDHRDHYIHLSDGGHFDNMGVYELVRRRCRYIVALDATPDRKATTDNLATMMRLCKTDFGVRIVIDTTPLEEQTEKRRTRWHCAVGQVHYEDVDPDALPGTLVYLKLSLTGDEPRDIEEYADKTPEFPHQPTLDQWFDEVQFESYRALGEHVAHDVFADAVAQMPEYTRENREKLFRDHDRERFFGLHNRELFSKLRNRWFPPPPDIEVNFREVSEAFGRLNQYFRDDDDLRQFSRDLYPELDLQARATDKNGDASRRAAELHAVNEILQVMQRAWLGVKIEGYHEHPMNRGWMNMFRRCARSRTIAKHWPTVRGGFSQEFVRFCEHELRLSDRIYTAEPQPLHVPDTAEGRSIRDLVTELAGEWPGEFPGIKPTDFDALWEKLTGRLAGFEVKYREDDTPVPPLWIIWGRDPLEEEARDQFAVGIVLARVDEKTPDVVEFFAWVRRSYRNLRIGHRCVGDPLGAVWERRGQGGRPFTLRVIYPKGATLDMGDRLQKELWKNFFHYFDFRVVPDAGSDKRLIMERTHRPLPQDPEPNPRQEDGRGEAEPPQPVSPAALARDQ